MSVWIILLIVVAFLLVLLSIGGSFLPVIPGPPLGLLGVLVLDLADPRFEVSTGMWIFLGILVALSILFDYFIPALMVRIFGGSNKGAVGATFGQLIGLYWGLLGSIVGSFLGTMAGEKLSHKDIWSAVKSGVGSTVGFVISAGVKVFISVIILIVFLYVFFVGL